MTEAAERLMHEGRELLLVRESEWVDGSKDCVYADEVSVLHISMNESAGTTLVINVNNGDE